MTDKPSISELQRIESRMERAPWDCTTPHTISNEEYDIGRFDGPTDALGAAAIRNAASVLLEIAAAALAVDEAKEAVYANSEATHKLRQIHAHDRLCEALARFRDALDRVRP